MRTWVIKHRCVGYPEQRPSEYTVEADTKDDAESKFWEAHWDLNAFVVSVEVQE